MYKKDSKKDNLDFSKNYNSAKQVIKKMSNTIDDFRNFCNPHRPKETFSMRSVINDAMLVMQGTLERHKIELLVDMKNEIHISGYISEFSQVLINLLNNSKDAFNQNNSINRVINLEIKKIDDNYAMITFMDNVGGIKEDIRYIREDI